MKKPYLLLLRISCILLMISTCVGQSAMTKSDFAEHGFSIVLPDEPTFASELKALGFSSATTPYDVVVKNTSQRNIAAFCVRFLHQYADGTWAPFSSTIALYPQVLLDPGAPNRHDRERFMEAGGALLINPDGIVSPGPPMPGKISVQVTPQKQVTAIGVETDAVVFADGGVWGPDNMHVAQSLQSKLNVQQELVEEISQRLANGEKLGVVLKEMRDSLTMPPADTSSSELPGRYMFRRSYLRQLTSTHGRAGEAAAKEELRRLTFSVKPNIHQEGGN